MAAILAGEAAVRIVPTLKNFHSEVRKGLKSQPHSLEVKVNPNLKEADAQMAEWRKRQELESVKVPVRADFQSFRKDLSQVEHIFQRSSLSKAIRVNLVVLGLDALPALAYAAGSAASGLDALAKSSLALPGILGGALASAGALATGIHGVKDAFQAYKQDSDAATESARKQQDADRDLTSAKRNLQDAIRDQKREMEDLNAEMRRSSLNEAEAVLSIQDDVDRLRKGGFKSVTEYQRAQLSLLQDTDRLSEVRRKNNRTIEDANKANSEGVYQSQKVQEALDRVAKATEALDESKLTKVSQALAKLSPNAAATVQAIHGLSSEWTKFVATPTQDALFEGLDRSLTNLGQKTLPLLGRGLSGVAGALNVNLKQVIASLGSGANTSLISRIFGDTQGGLENASRGVNSLIHAFLQLTASSADFLPRLGDAATKVFAKFDAWTTKISQNGSLKKWIDTGLKAVDALGRSIIHISSIIDSVTIAFDKASGHTGGFIDSLDHGTAKLADFLSSDKGQDKLTNYFKGAGELVRDLGHDLKEAKPLFHDLATAAHDWGGVLFGVIGKLGQVADLIQRNTGLVTPLVEAYLGFRSVKPIIDGVVGSVKAYDKITNAVARQGGVGGLLSNALTDTKTNLGLVGTEAQKTSVFVQVAADEEVAAENRVTKSALGADAAMAAGGAGGKGGKGEEGKGRPGRLGGLLGGIGGAAGPLAIVALLASLGDQGLESLNGKFNTDKFTKFGEVPGSGLWFSHILGLASGGLVKGVGGPTDDMNLVAMSPGEHVAQAKAVNYYGPKLFDDLNNMRIPKHVTGGFQLTPPNPLIPQPPAPAVPAPPAITAPLGPPVPETTFGGALSSVGPPTTDLGGLAQTDVRDSFSGGAGAFTPLGTGFGGPTPTKVPSQPGFDFGDAASGLGRLSGKGSVLDQTITPTLPLTTGLAPGEKPYSGGKSLAPGSLSGLEDRINPRDLVPFAQTDTSKFGSWWPKAGSPSAVGRGNTAAGGNSAFDAYMQVRNSGPIDPRLDEYWRAKGFDPTTGGSAPASKSLAPPHVQTPVTPGQSDGAVPLGNTPIYSYTPGPAGPVIAPSGPVMGQMRSAIDSLVGTPYVWGGWSPAGVDCSGLASLVANIASGRPAFSSRFDTHSELGELTSRGFLPGRGGPGMLTIGWNADHTAITLPDGTAVSSGENGGVQYGGGGSNESQFDQWMHLPVDSGALDALSDPATLGIPALNGQLGGALPAFLQPDNILNFFGSQAQNVGQGVAGIGLQLLQGLTGINLGPLLGEGQQLGNGVIGALGGKGGGGGGLLGGLGGLLGGGSGINGIAGADMGRYVNGQLPLGASPGSSANSVSYTPGGGAEQWRPVVRQVLSSVGPKYGITPANEKAWEDAIVKQIGTESQGNPNSINAHDSNGHGGTQQVGGLLNFLPATFNSNNILGGSFMDPQAQIAAAIPYVVNKYGVNADGSPKGIGLGHGFKSGGYPGGSALVSSGEFITNNKATSYYGPGLYNALNSMRLPKKFLGGFDDGGFPLDIPGITQPAPGQSPQSPGPLPADSPAPAPPMPNPAQPGDQPQAPGPLDLGQAPQVAGSPSTGGPPGPGAPAPAPDPGTLPQVAATLAGAMPGTGGGAGGGLAQPGATPSADGAQPRATLGAAPKSQQHTNPAISKGIQGAAGTIGSLAAMAAQAAISAGSFGAGAPAGAAASQGIQAGAQMAGQVADAAVNVLSSLLVGTATNGSTQSASGVPLLPARAPMQSGVPQINQRNHYGDIHVTDLDQFKRTQQRMDAQDVLPYIGAYGA